MKKIFAPPGFVLKQQSNGHFAWLFDPENIQKRRRRIAQLAVYPEIHLYHPAGDHRQGLVVWVAMGESSSSIMRSALPRFYYLPPPYTISGIYCKCHFQAQGLQSLNFKPVGAKTIWPILLLFSFSRTCPGTFVFLSLVRAISSSWMFFSKGW